MNSVTEPRVIEAQRMRDGVIIVFDDGTCALYSASLLHATLSRAEQFHEPELDAEDSL